MDRPSDRRDPVAARGSAAAVLLAACAIAGSVFWGWSLADSGAARWREQAYRQATAITEDIHRDMLQASAQLTALSTLFLASERVEGVELLAAEALIPADPRTTAFRSLAFAASVLDTRRDEHERTTGLRLVNPDGSAVAGSSRPLHLAVTLGSKTSRFLRPGLDLAALPPFRVAAFDALDERGRAVMGPAFLRDGRWLAPFAIAAANAGRQGVLFGVLSLDDAFDRASRRTEAGLRFVIQQVPTAENAADDPGGEATDGHLQIIGGNGAATEVGEAEFVQWVDHDRATWRIAWTLLPGYRGGVDYRPAWMAAIGGSLLSILVAVVVVALVRQNALVRRQVLERTMELSDALGRLALASRAKSRFLAIVGHELRTPLNWIIGFADLLDAKQTTDSARNQVRSIADGGRHLLGLINDLISVADAESGQLQLDRSAVDPGELVRDVVQSLEPIAARHGVRFEVGIQPGLPPLTCDRQRLGQALSSLCLNALAASPENGQVLLRALHRTADRTFLFVVQDRGQGLSADELRSAQELFQQLEDPLTRRQQGLGIGLPLCRHLIELHGGRLLLDSTPGSGTVATIELPGVVDGMASPPPPHAA